MSTTTQNSNARIFARLPGQQTWDAVASAACDAGATVFRDAPAAGATALRTTPTATGAAAQVLMGAEWWTVDGMVQAIGEALSGGAEVWAEVRDGQEARTAIAAGAHGVVACGSEGGGLVGHDTALVLLRRVLAATPDTVPVAVRGGVGPDTAASCLTAGASAVMLDVQLWAANDAPTPDALRSRLDGFNPLDTACFGIEQGFRFRTFGQLATRAVREIQKIEGAGGLSPAGLMAEIDARLVTDLTNIDMKQQLVPLGQDAA
ncbi:MAG: nitronate monooxygenase, partial [Myxococcota bacterium]|nr:nitronate monooxygenase [Myxococcota bacterium]